MVELFLAKEGIGVRFPLAAPNKKFRLVRDFLFGIIMMESNGLQQATTLQQKWRQRAIDNLLGADYRNPGQRSIAAAMQGEVPLGRSNI